jgi:predicted glycoside hydrolase/deacetylase ChbG (UPF0249 family)
MSRRLTLCADDYAQSEAISLGILQLIDAGRLSATSVFSQSPYWSQVAPALLHAPVDVGLHINLTESFVPGSHPLSYWLLRSQLRWLSRNELRTRILLQIDAFSDALGRLPDYLDGHQHVHALPVVRQALSDAVALRWQGRRERPYIRLPDRLVDAGDSGLKGQILKSCCLGFRRHLRQHQLSGPDWFAGLYSLRPEADYPRLMQRWLRQCPDQGLIMCHPGLTDTAPDPIAATRPQEYRYLASEAFALACAEHNIHLARYQPQI